MGLSIKVVSDSCCQEVGFKQKIFLVSLLLLVLLLLLSLLLLAFFIQLKCNKLAKGEVHGRV